MKKLEVSMIAGLLLACSALESQATVDFYDNFSYPDGNLTNGVNWFQTAAAANPVQVSGGAVVLGTSGQDVYSPLTTPLNFTDGQTFYIGATVDITAAQATGDYFLHWSNPVGTTSIFQERLYAKSVIGGFVFGYDGSSGTPLYSASVLSLNTTYRIVLAYTAVVGATNDTLSLYVNPTDLSVQANNTPYYTSGYVSTSNETNIVAAINLRQGTAANAPSVILDNLTVGTLFSDAAPVAPAPEPSTVALAAMGGAACLVAFRRKR
jgi:hypothetical protein